jgi:hypothetical protein
VSVHISDSEDEDDDDDENGNFAWTNIYFNDLWLISCNIKL